MRHYFGTDGIRGRANRAPMTADLALRLGQALVEQFRTQHEKPRIVVGKDPRISGYVFEMAVAAGITAMGGNVLLTGPLPTPGIAFLARSMRADAGVVISASHNPFDDNGLKVFDRQGFKLSDEVEEQLEARMDDPDLSTRAADGTHLGRAFKIDDAVGRYVVYLKNVFPQHLTLEGLRLVLDCANGAAYKVAPLVFEELGATVIRMGCEPDGLNINRGVGALHPEGVQRAVVEHRADLGICLDGDADRVILVDEKGEKVDGDRIMAILALLLREQGRLRRDTIVATSMSNLGLEVWARENGFSLLRTDVGDRYVVERLRDESLNFGGEQSGHIIALDVSTTGDGVLSALQVLAAMGEWKKPLSALPGGLRRFPQELKNVRVAEKIPFDDVAGLRDLEASFQREVGDRGRLVLRYSGTELLARVMVEAEDERFVRSWTARFVEHLERAIGGER
jgi:phosphoglucosamine mutase